MKYKLIGENDYLINPIATVLKNRGIKYIESFLNVDESVINDWRLLKNINKAVDCFLKHVLGNSKIYIQIDSDNDGYVSAALLHNYMKRIKTDISLAWDLHDTKMHGVNLEQVPGDCNLVIIPDAGSNQYEEHKFLHEKGIDVIVLDHHQCEKESEHAIVVNNQLSPDYPNKNFSGVGIVYKFCKALDNKLGVNYADDYLDLVAIGNIADNIDMRELETRYYVLKGLRQIRNPFLKALIEKQSYSMKGKVNITNIAFYISPLINAVTRVGTKEEKINVFKCLTESDEQVYYKKKDQYESIHVNTARQLANVRVRQNKLRDQGVAQILERIQDKELDKNKILIVNVTGILEKSLSGLVANRIAEQYRRPVVLLRQYDDDENLYGGSARGYDKSEIKNFRQFLLDTGMFNFCEGHDNAFGYEIHKDKIVAVNDYINELLKDVEMGSDVYEVDFIIPAKQLTSTFVTELSRMRDLWGYKVEEPLLVVKEIETEKKNVFLNKSTMKFIHKDIEFIKFQTTQEEYDEIMSKNGNGLSFNILGRCSENEWNGKVTPQIIIDDYECTGKKIFTF
jgi:single-stranded-DNA-specific exonuclease